MGAGWGPPDRPLVNPGAPAPVLAATRGAPPPPTRPGVTLGTHPTPMLSAADGDGDGDGDAE